ncbi:uncharacterized protein YtpQ (UPF0354 family) [Metabacillus crassostreae]|uniref:DUF1444 domain-containing protein n=1 Tax=Metabacillus crassostreae TaxID=929098 RepID=UPI001EF84C6F|nr:DUF1444 domain-containing protein [Metabacillus crassostreae]MBM7606145.1 uncharacterized protein YtpQ (UPF0354 family) [Metabacillus crassostreae]
MKMTSRKLVEMLKEKLNKPEWQFNYDREKDTLRVEDSQSNKGVTLTLPRIIAKWENTKEQAIDEVVYYVKEALTVMNEEQEITGKERSVYPVIRSTSFPSESNEGIKLFYSEHTAETRIYYALDLGKTYRLIDEKMIEKEGWTKEQLKEIALFNVRSLKTSVKEDVVAGNVFYFLNANDGYDASRILNESLLQSFEEKIEGQMAVAVPHQDVLLIVDIRNDTGYDILAQLTMSFFASGTIPITALSFLYEEKKLEPIFILGKNKPHTNQ